jgi:predicted RND superfamily exporter protein
MGLTKIPIGVATQIMPSFLMSVGVGATVHILVVFFQAYDRGESREEALAYALGHSGLAVIMTSLTTAGGLLSFAVAEVSPVAVLGIFTPVGIILGLAYTLILMPAMLAIVPLVRRDPAGSKAIGTRITQRCLLWIGDKCVDHSWVVIVGMSCVLLVSFVGMTKLKFEYNPVHWFPPDHKVRISIEHVDKNLGGAHSLEVLVDTGRENGLLEPELLNNFEKIGYRMAVMEGDGGAHIVKVVSINQVLKETHQALNSNNPEYYVIPQDRKLIAQELLLFENSGTDDLEDLVDSNFQLARFSLKLPYVAPAYFHKFFPEVLDQFKQVLGDDVEILGTGNVALVARSMDVLRRSLTKSYGIALLIITPLMILLLGSFRAGLTAMVPNLSPIICTLGLMGWFGIPLDPFTLLIGSIAIGLAVDDTIHFMHNFRKYFEEFGESKMAVRETLRTTGSALLMTSIVLSLGFFIYIFSTLDNLTFFGLLTGFTILIAFLADVTISPAVMTLFMRYHDRERKEESLSPGE